MARVEIGTNPVQVAYRNPRRHQISVQMLPSSIVAGNTGLVYGKFGSAPKPDPLSNTWDFVLNPGAADGANLYETTEEAYNIQDLYLVADTAGQIVNVVETEINPPAVASASGALPA